MQIILIYFLDSSFILLFQTFIRLMKEKIHYVIILFTRWYSSKIPKVKYEQIEMKFIILSSIYTSDWNNLIVEKFLFFIWWRSYRISSWSYSFELLVNVPWNVILRYTCFDIIAHACRRLKSHPTNLCLFL